MRYAVKTSRHGRDRIIYIRADNSDDAILKCDDITSQYGRCQPADIISVRPDKRMEPRG